MCPSSPIRPVVVPVWGRKEEPLFAVGLCQLGIVSVLVNRFFLFHSCEAALSVLFWSAAPTHRSVSPLTTAQVRGSSSERFYTRLSLRRSSHLQGVVPLVLH